MVIAFDVETHLIKPGLTAPKLVCLSLSDNSLWSGSEGPSVFRDLLDAGHTLVAHNAPFDLGVLCAEDPSLLQEVFGALEEGRVKCTEVRERLINNASGELTFRQGKKVSYSLASLVERHFGEILPKEDTWRLKYALLDSVPLEQWPEEARAYAIRDAVEALRVYQRQEEIAGGAIPDERRQQCAAWWLHLCSMWGLRTDARKTGELKARLEQEVSAVRPTLLASGYLRSDGTKDMKKIQAKILETVPNVPKTPTGLPDSSVETLELTQDPALVALAKTSRAHKLLSTYVPVLEAGTKAPLCAHYTSLVESGRTSCSAPNIQNLPSFPGVRECYVPRPGFVYCSVDYDTLELRALAQVCLELFGRSKMAEELRAGRDLHTAFAAQLLRRPYEEVFDGVKSGDVACKKARKMAKVFLFGIPGGMGAQKFVGHAASQGVVLTLAEVKRYKAEYLLMFPEMTAYFALISKMTAHGSARVGPPLTTLVRGDVRFSELANMLFQSRAAAGGKDAGWLVTRACHEPDSPLHGSRVVAWIHDEILAEIPISCLDTAPAEIVRLMCLGMGGIIPDVPITASPKVMPCWTKD